MEGKFHLIDADDVVMRPHEVAELIIGRNWTLAQAAEYLGCSSSHVGSFLRRNGYRQNRSWGEQTTLEGK